MNTDFTTPMMKQYMDIKNQYKDCLLFFRMGDFYELFLEDAHIGAQVLNITLTSRAKGRDGRIPMAGVPYHAVDAYLGKLVKAGYKVAICEQMSEPNKYGIVDREVIRIVTPGTLLDEHIIDKKKNNYVMALHFEKDSFGIAVADISTGQFLTNEFPIQKKEQVLRDEVAKLNPAECILSDNSYNDPSLLKLLRVHNEINIFPFNNWEQYATKAESILKKHFALKALDVFGIQDKKTAIQASSILLEYLRHTQKDNISHIKKISILTSDKHMLLDRSTMINLELFSTIREHDKNGSLFNVIDHTVTAMGGRMLHDVIVKPLINKQEIQDRHTAVEYYLKNRVETKQIRETLKQINDIERLVSKLAVGIGNARDLVNLKLSLKVILEIKEYLSKNKGSLVHSISKNIHQDIEKVVELIQTNFVDEPPIETKEGRMIRKQVNKELDILKDEVENCNIWLEQFEVQEKHRSGISSLKVRFNEVFGFFIEVTKANAALVPANYIRKQTMVNGERYITPELKEKEIRILSARDKMNSLEFRIFKEILNKVLNYTAQIQQTAQSIALLDCILNFAYIADKYEYSKPTIIDTGEMKITCGRHAVVETLLHNEQFVPNDVTLDHESHQLLIITGPNMAGKSVFIRQVALITLLSQIGSFVPAEKAELSVVDRIYVRSGASDVITSGLSTFMVEMVETAHILNSCTKDSLIIMDEIGRGTSTYDGISIAWAVAEHLANSSPQGPKTLFATHYHELQELSTKYPNKIKNYHMGVEKQKDEPIFLHTLMEGGASHSYGVSVAKLAGVPEEVTKRAWEILESLEKGKTTINQDKQAETKNRKENSNIVKKLKQVDIHTMTPLEAMNFLAEIKEDLKS